LGYFVDTFGRFAQLLDMNCEAFYNSFSAVLRVFESLGHLKREFFFVFQTWTFFRLGQLLVRKLNLIGKGLNGGQLGFDLDSFNAFSSGPDGGGVGDGRAGSKRKRNNYTTWILFLVSIVLGPLIINSLWRRLKATLPPVEDSMNEAWGKGNCVKALFDFPGQSHTDLPFRKGDMLRLLNKTDSSWWEAELNGRVGMIPANYVEHIIEPAPSSSPSGEPRITELS